MKEMTCKIARDPLISTFVTIHSRCVSRPVESLTPFACVESIHA